MYSLEVIKSLNNKAATPSAVQSRDCSVCFSRGGAVIHSARHRDTVFIYGSAKRIIRKLRDLKESGLQSALNSYIEELYSKYSA
jgi:hypothetical protein